MPSVTNIFDRFAAVAGKFPDHVAVETCRRTGTITHTYAELRLLAERIAGLLVSLGAVKGTRCALVADNDARWCGTYLGILRIGGIAVPLDTWSRPGQVRTLVGDSGAALVFTTLRHLPAVQEALQDLASPPPIVLVDGSAPGAISLDAATGAGEPTSLPACPAEWNDPAVILYTSGTTSDPKGVVLTHGNLLAERDAAFRSSRSTSRTARSAILPLFHALAQLANLLLPLRVGARVVFLETLNSTEMMRALAERSITAFCVVPQFFYLIHQRVMERVETARVLVRVTFRAMLGVNGWLRRFLHSTWGRVLFRQVHAALGDRMRLLVTGRIPLRSANRPRPLSNGVQHPPGLWPHRVFGRRHHHSAQGDAHIESVGQPLPGVEVRIADAADGRATATIGTARCSSRDPS